MLKVYLLRHGETSMNADGNRYCGRTDVELTEKGIGQANNVKEQVKDIQFDAVFCSPLIRSSATAKIAAEGNEIKEDARLIEVDFGNWEGKTREEFIAEDPDSWKQWNADPMIAKAGSTGETAKEVVERVNSFFEEVRNTYPNGTVMVVGHNGINRLFLAWKLSMELKNYRRILQENSAVTLFTLDQDNEMQIQLLNCRR